MATEVYTTEVIRLLDETEVEVRPLPIAKLRKFMRLWSNHIQTLGEKLGSNTADGEVLDFTEADMTDAQFDTFIKLCALGLSAQLQGDKTDKQFASYLEDVLDEQTIYRILDLIGGLKLGPQSDSDPNLMPPQAGAGTN